MGARIISASAGSGKTYTLVSELLSIVSREQKIPYLLATTFTRKAAGEIYQKLLLRLLEENLSFKSQDGDSIPVIEALLLHSESMLISTLDSFFISIARAFSKELDMPLQWRIADEFEIEEISSFALKKTLQSLGLETILLLIPLLFRRSESIKILSTLDNDLQELINEELPSDSAAWKLTNPFQKNDFEYSVDTTVDNLLERIDTPGTLKSQKKVFVTLLKHIKNESWESLLEETILQNILTGKFSYQSAKLDEPLVEELQKLAQLALYNLYDDIEGQGLALLSILSEFQHHLLQQCKEKGVFTFSQITRIVALQAENLPQSELFYRMDSKIDHLLIDEFQDTSLSQWTALEPLASDIIQSDNTRNFLAVGDVKQAIYGWRGGVSEIFNHLYSSFPERLSTQDLFLSYRSSQGVIDLVNRVFSKLEENTSLSAFPSVTKSWDEKFVAHESFGKVKNGYIKISSINATDKDEITHERFSLILEAIKRHQTNSSRNQTLGILVPTNALALEIESLLRENHISFGTKAGKPLKGFYFTQVIISALTYVAHPDDKLSYQHILSSGYFINKDESPAAVHRALTNDLISDGLSSGLLKLILHFRPLLSEQEVLAAHTILTLARGFERDNIYEVDRFISILNKHSLKPDSLGAITVLTVHASKGLEFDTVILPFPDAAFFNESKMFLLKDQKNPFSPATKVMRTCRKTAREMIPDMNLLADQWKNEKSYESLCVTYVAITRAKSSIEIYLTPSKKACSDIPSFSNILRACFGFEASLPPGALLYSSGCEQAELEEVFDPSKKLSKEVELPVPPIKSPKAIPDFANKKSETTIQPSQLSNSYTRFLLKGFGESSRRNKRLGTTLHQMIENLYLFDSPDNLLGAASANKFYTLEEHPSQTDSKLADQDALEILSKALTQGDFQKLFLESHYSSFLSDIKCFTEFRFTLATDSDIQTGIIDRFIVGTTLKSHQSWAHIVDFKLHLENPEDARPQLAAYSAAISSLFAVTPENIKISVANFSNTLVIDL